MDITELRRQIKHWEHEFKKLNNRPPSKLDVKENIEISKLYSLYKAIKQGKAIPSKEPPPLKQSPLELIPESPIKELGPTPQANGKVLSIFDFRMTPPESSPLKRKSTNTELKPLNNMAPPESPIKKIQLQTPTKPKSRKPDFSTPTKKPTAISFETPDYLSRGIARVLKPEPTTPTSGRKLTFSSIGFSVSPSPLKINRFGKKLAEVYNASIHEMDLEIPEIENSDEETDEDEMDVVNTTFKKKKTQKRSTRRGKLAPISTEETSTLVNVKQEMNKIEEHEKKRLAAYINSDEEFEEEKNVFKDTDTSVKKTRKPVADNYKRLKINDARSRNFKRRMKR